MKYNTVKTAKLVDENVDSAARRAIDACPFLTPETERDIDLALGIGIMDLEPEVVENRVHFRVAETDTTVDIMVEDGPTEAELAKIEAEQEDARPFMHLYTNV